MGFTLYKAGTSGNWLRADTLKLSGKDGLIAKHVKEQGNAIEQTWQLSSRELKTMVGGSIFFEHKDGKGHLVAVSFLHSLIGRTGGDRTDLTLHMIKILEKLNISTEELALTGVKIEEGKGDQQFLSLTLNGGTSGGNWKWMETPIALNAAAASPKT